MGEGGGGVWTEGGVEGALERSIGWFQHGG